MSPDWSRYALIDLVRLLGSPPGKMVPELETVACYQVLRDRGWPGGYVDWHYTDPSDPDRMCRCSFLMWGTEVYNAKGETPTDVIDGRYVSLAGWRDASHYTTVPVDDREINLPPSMISSSFASLLTRLDELSSLDATLPATATRPPGRL